MPKIDFAQMQTADQIAVQAMTDAHVQACKVAADKLAQTDWYIIREQETGKPTPKRVRDERAIARRVLSED